MTASIGVTVEDIDFPGPHGPVRVRSYRPGDEPRGGLVWLHGGGFVSGDLDMPESDWVAHEAATTGISVITVAYRLAPVPEWMAPGQSADGVAFPIASDEVTAVFTAASRFDSRIQPDKWALGGASAGANLAVGASLRLRDGRRACPHSVVLAYPLLHARLPDMSPELRMKYELLPERDRISPEMVGMLNQNYVGDVALLRNPYAFAGGSDLDGFPPTLIVNSDHDSIRASGDAFGAELIAAGAPVTVMRERDTRHGHLNEPQLPGAKRTMQQITRWLAYRSGTY